MKQTVSQHSTFAPARTLPETPAKPSRRAILKGMPGTALAAASIAPALAMAGAVLPSPDAELLALVLKIEAVKASEKVRYMGTNIASVERAELVGELTKIRARTLEGIRAKASCMDDESIEWHCDFLECAMSIFADIQALNA